MIRINLLPVRASRQRETGVRQVAVAAAVVVAVAATLWSPVRLPGNRAWMAAQIDETKGDVRTTREEIERLEKIIGQVNKFSEDKKRFEDTLAIIKQLAKGRTGPVRMMDEIAVRIPKKVWLTEMTEKAGILDVQGEAVSSEEVSTFMNELGKSPYFTGLELKYVQRPDKVSADLPIMTFALQSKIEYAP